jgi:site-specific recombinase XerD
LLVSGHVSGDGISNSIHDISRLAQVAIHSLHQFRHSCASDLLEAGVHLAEAQRILVTCPYFRTRIIR